MAKVKAHRHVAGPEIASPFGLRVTDQIKRDKLRAAGWTDADKEPI